MRPRRYVELIGDRKDRRDFSSRRGPEPFRRDGRPRSNGHEIARERRLAVAEERNRIARDLHGSAAHAINVILVQAGGARLLQERDPGAVSAALSIIEDVARETIEEIDQLIHGLRTTDESNQTTEQVEPRTGLTSVPTLLRRHQAAGMTLKRTSRDPCGRWLPGPGGSRSSAAAPCTPISC